MNTRSMRWGKSLVICLIVAFLAGLVWITLEDILPPDFRTEAARSAAVVYGTAPEGAGRSQIVIEEIWKQPPSGGELTVGAAITVRPVPLDARPDGFVVFLQRPWPWRRGPLQAQGVVYVYQGRLGRPDISIEEAKAICANTPSL